MSTKAYYKHEEIGAGKVGFSRTRSIIEAAFYGNNVVKVNTLKEAYDLAKNSPGTIVTDMPVYRGEEFGLEKDAKVLLFNDGAVTGRYATARRIKGEPGVDDTKHSAWYMVFQRVSYTASITTLSSLVSSTPGSPLIRRAVA